MHRPECRYGPQAQGGRKELLDGVTTPDVFSTDLFEGNPEERSGRKLHCAMLLTINRSTPLFSGLAPTLIRSVARVTWSAGFGGGLNKALLDVGPGGAIFTLGATKYLKVEIAHTVQPAGAIAPCTFDLSWVDASSGARIPAYFTSRVGNVGAGARSAPAIIPSYAQEAMLLGNPAPGASDSIGFYTDTSGATLLADVTQRTLTTIPIIGGAEAFDVSSLAGGAYTVLWKLRL